MMNATNRAKPEDGKATQGQWPATGVREETTEGWRAADAGVMWGYGRPLELERKPQIAES